jgi:diacylglycerol kinase family enzyme
VDSLSVPATLLRLPLITLGKHAWLKAYHPAQITQAVIETKDDETLIAQADGELFVDSKFEVEILPNALQIIVAA